MADVVILQSGIEELMRGLDAGIEHGLARFVRDEAARLAPVGGDGDPHAGRLRDSLVVRRGDGGVSVVTTAPEALPNEFGTRFMTAQPFLTPALVTGMAHAGELVAGPMRRAIGQ